MSTNIDLRKTEVEELGIPQRAQGDKPIHLRLAWHTSRARDERRELVLLDPKDYGNNADDDTGSIVYDRVKELASMLHSLQPVPDDSGLRTLRCKGWYEDQSTAQFYFVYHLPSECNSASGHAEFLSLDKTYKISKPSIGARIRLAQSLATTLLKIHEEGWLHKGIQSRHVLFFPSHQGGRPNLEHPRLVGFDYARRDKPNEYSEKPIDKHANLYRHPDALRDPTTRFQKIHDYYSLGVVLVEIACWRPVTELVASHSEFWGKECKEEDLRKVRDMLMQPYAPGGSVDTSFRMGDIYRGVVETCLCGNFDNIDDQDLLSSFKQRVVLELERCVI